MKTFAWTLVVVLALLAGCDRTEPGAVEPTPLMEIATLVPSAGEPAGPTAASGSPVEPTATPAVPAGPDAPGGLCGNPYYPVIDGATFAFITSDSTEVLHTISVEEDGVFKLAVLSGDATAILEGLCTEEGMILLETGMGADFFLESGSSSSTTSLAREGVTLPNDLGVGTAWTQTYGILAEGTEEAWEWRVITNSEVVGFETVTVPAGTFEALRIEQHGTMLFRETEIRSVTTLWYAVGIGTVQSASGLEGGEMTFLYLVSYEFP